MKINNIWGRQKLNTHLIGVIIILLFLCVTSFANNEVPARRFEYKLSFKGPYLVLSNGTVPFWQHHGSAIASDESVRITPSLKSKKGSIWSNELSQFENWEVEVTFRISGRGRIGADGLAVWFTTEKGEEGEVFGSKDKWNGLGVFFDSFDNDSKHNNPFIMAMLNDGTRMYDHEADGSNQQLGGCLRDFRNRPHPNRVKIQYYKKILSVFFNNGLNEDADNYDLCFKVDSIDLSRHGYFGVSAATGGLADDHDVLAFETYSLRAPTTTETETKVIEDERLKFEKEYNDYLEKMEKAKEEYKKEHPKTRPDADIDDNSIFEGQEARELRQIFQGQHEIANMIRVTVTRLDELVIKQEKQEFSLSHISEKLDRQLPPGSNMGQGDIEQVMRAQTLFAGDIKELKSYVSELGNNLHIFKTQEINNNEKRAQTLHSKVQDEIRELSKQLSNMEVQLATAGKSSSCITLLQVILMLTFHLVTILTYLIMKARREAAAKKLF